MRAAAAAEPAVWRVSVVDFVVRHFEIVLDEMKGMEAASYCHCNAELWHGVDLPGVQAGDNLLRGRKAVSPIVVDVKEDGVCFPECALGLYEYAPSFLIDSLASAEHSIGWLDIRDLVQAYDWKGVVVFVIRGRVVIVGEVIAGAQWQSGRAWLLLCFALACRVRVDAVS